MRVLGVFAHNESTRIQRCLESIEAANPNRGLRCIVLANGCTDNTADLARNYANGRKWIEVKEIAVGDKANAWNLFVHEIAAKESEIYIFMDGDCTVQAGAFQALEQALAHAPLANAATGIPRRTLTSFGGFRRSLMKNPGVAGNLYALPLQFIKRIKLANVRLPVGLVGDDSLVGALACWDLDPSKKNWDFNRIVVVREAEFGYDSILSSTFGAPSFIPDGAFATVCDISRTNCWVGALNNSGWMVSQELSVTLTLPRQWSNFPHVRGLSNTYSTDWRSYRSMHQCCKNQSQRVLIYSQLKIFYHTPSCYSRRSVRCVHENSTRQSVFYCSSSGRANYLKKCQIKSEVLPF